MTRHLQKHRGMIAGRATLASALRLMPVPVLDELLSGAVRVTLLQRIADARHVDVERAGLEHLARPEGLAWIDLAANAASAAALFRSGWRRLVLPLRIAGRADEAAATFALATLFDHYCAIHHVGLGLDEAAARRLHEVIAGAIGDARGRLSQRMARAAARGSADLLLAAPRALARGLRPDRRASGAIEDDGRRRDRGAPPSDRGLPERVVGARAGLSTRTLPGRAVARVSGALEAIGGAWLDELTAAFDARWIAARDGGSDGGR